MNKFYSFLVYLLLSFVFISIQISLTTPSFLNLFTPDLNLILIIYLASANNIYGSFYLTVINGLLMDIFSGNMIGIYTLTRLVVYTIIKSSSKTFNINTLKPKILSILIGTIIFWILLYFVLKFKISEPLNITLNLIIHQATINTLVGSLIFILLGKINAKL
ncbi:MAG: rod shape-determining protein MreD [Candidatus Dadabacteria bacterium]|nr:rod shape-determining protein MreD [Candidatus Dadabacteria bacterium]NIQ14170.1 rod shape-determining protein MreD [Candidatus Dadabacteria bacterium]